MNTLTVTLTEAQMKALAHVAYDPQQWLQTVAESRAETAIDEIFKNEVEKAVQDNSVTSIPADRIAVVMAANIKTAVEIHEESLAEMQRIREASLPPAE